MEVQPNCLTIYFKQQEQEQDKIQNTLEMIHNCPTKVIIIIGNVDYYNFLSQGLIILILEKCPKIEYIFVINDKNIVNNASPKIVYVQDQAEIDQFLKSKEKKNSFEGQKLNEFGIPIILEQLVSYFSNNLDHEGLFRKCAIQSEIVNLLEEVKQYHFTNIENANPHLIACVLKQYLMSLPYKLINSKLVFQQDVDLIIVLNDLSEMNNRVLYFLISFFKEVAKNEIKNKMNIKSLSMLLAPTFIEISTQPQQITMQISQSISFLSKLMESFDILAPKYYYQDFLTTIEIVEINEVTDKELIMEWQKLNKQQIEKNNFQQIM